jgi:uncharacterized membrane protein YfhO
VGEHDSIEDILVILYKTEMNRDKKIGFKKKSRLKTKQIYKNRYEQ